MKVLGYLCYLFFGELDVFLLKGFSPLAQVNEQHLIFTVTVFHQLSVLFYGTGFAVTSQNPKRYADVGGIEHITRKNHNGFHQMVIQQLTTYVQFSAISTQRTVGKQETCHSIGRQFRYNIQNPTVIRVTGRRHIVTVPAWVGSQLIFCTPCFLVKRRISHDKIGLQILVLVIVKGIGGFFS